MAPTPRAVAIWPAVRDALRQLRASLIPCEFVFSGATLTFVLAMADSTAASREDVSDLRKVDRLCRQLAADLPHNRRGEHPAPF